jgi:hypothetical protein
VKHDLGCYEFIALWRAKVSTILSLPVPGEGSWCKEVLPAEGGQQIILKDQRLFQEGVSVWRDPEGAVGARR